MRIGQDLVDELVEHARAEAPNECCGFITGKDGAATRVYPARNARGSSMAFEIDGADQIRIYGEIDDNEERDGPLAAMYPSHPRTEAYPSQTDLNFGKEWTVVEWVIVSLRDDVPEVRAFVIDANGGVDEVPIE